MPVEDGRHTTYPYLEVGVSLTERVDKGEVVGDKFIAVVGPIARIGIVKPKVYNGLVGSKGERIAEGLLADVGAMATTQEGGT